MTTYRPLKIALAALLTLALLALVVAVLPSRPVPSAQAEAVTSYNTVQVLAFGGVTQTQASSVFVAGYGLGDCYAQTTQAVSPTTALTTTFTLSHSWDNKSWVTLYTYTAQPTNTVDFTRTLIYGGYLKASATFNISTRPVTGAVVCVLKNVQ